jgi:hypothetical protein
MVLAAAGFFLVVLVALAVVLDVGWWLHDKRDAQNDVDAVVLAGAQGLPDEGIATNVAETWGARNGATGGELVCCEFEDLSGDGGADLIRARVEREPGSLAGNLLDVGIVTITAEAAAAKQRAVASCVPPWAVLGDPGLGPDLYWGLDLEELYIFHQSEFDTPGNFGALRLYGNGLNEYREALLDACGTSGAGCAGGEPIEPGETLDCETQPGAGGINTCDPLSERYGGDCHGLAPGDGCDAATYAIAADLAETGTCSDRKMPVPIIDAWPPGGASAPVQILGLATFYIAGWDRTPPYGDEDIDGDTVSDDAMVWGYFLQDQPISEAWNIDWGYSDDPFAPIRVLLVE